jgi:hypothetical protein
MGAEQEQLKLLGAAPLATHPAADVGTLKRYQQLS